VIQLRPLEHDPAALRQIFGCFPSGVVALCAKIGGVPVGMAASSFTSVSLAPSLVSINVQRTSATWPRLRQSARIGVSVLAEAHEAVCLQLSRKAGDRFAGIDWGSDAAGSVFIRNAAAGLDCSVHAEHPAGDHEIVLLEIHRMAGFAEMAPLVFHGSGFRTLHPGEHH
jgi:flavin reductase (DIM6/NTAB) family NADH-FMN oxidoreductase RutF